MDVDANAYILAEVDDLSAIHTPLKSTQRIKYTCFNISKHFLVLGASSGGLYVFKREPCIFLQLLPNKEGSVTQISISPDEALFSFATHKGIICIVERSQSPKVRRPQTCTEHQGSDITALHWNGQGSELFIGDDQGRVSLISTTQLAAKTMFQNPWVQLMQLDSRIVQLDWCRELLLVSTMTRCYICDTSKEQYRQIGQKLRDGDYGACFYITEEENSNQINSVPQKNQHDTVAFSSVTEEEAVTDCEGLQDIRMFCARPGARLWEVQANGIVLSTRQFRQAFNIPPSKIIRLNELHSLPYANNVQDIPEVSPEISINFTKLYMIVKKFIFTYKCDGLFLLDPKEGKIMLWNNETHDIADAKALNDTLYVWTSSGKLHGLLITSIDKFVVKLYLRRQYTLCANMCAHYSNYLMKLVPNATKLHVILDLPNKLEDSNIITKISQLMEEIAKHAQQRQHAQKLQCGIFLVNNYFHSWEDEDARQDTCGVYQVMKKVQSDKEKAKSLDGSPKSQRKRFGKNLTQPGRCGSTASLPELVHAVDHLNHCLTNIDQHGEQAHSKPHETLVSELGFPPEAVHALMDLGQTFSWKIVSGTKSLKDKLQEQFKEGKLKILIQESYAEPFDVRTSDYKKPLEEQNVTTEIGEEELIHTSGDKSRNKVSQLPVLDISKISELCVKLDSNEKELVVRDLSQTGELLISVLRVYEEFLIARKQMHTECQGPSIGTTLENLQRSFPLHHYFSKDTLRVLRVEFHQALKSGQLITWLYNHEADVELFMLEFPKHVVEIFSQNALKMDSLFSTLLIIFSDVLDAKLVTECIVSSDLVCYYGSLCIILDRYQDGNVYFTTENNVISEVCGELPLSLLLNTMFYMLSMDNIEACCNMGHAIELKAVWFLILRLHDQLENSGSTEVAASAHCYLLFLQYLEKVPGSLRKISEALTEGHLRQYITKAFIELNGHAGKACSCGFPLPGLPSLKFSNIAQQIVNFYLQDEVALLELCQKMPALWSLILPHWQGKDFFSVLPLLVHLGKTSELAAWAPDMDYNAWKKTLNHLVSFHRRICLNCHKEFSLPVEHLEEVPWSSIGTLMLRMLGPSTSVKLLTEYAQNISPGQLNIRFFQACIFSAIVEKHNRGLRKQLLNIFSDNSMHVADVELFSPTVATAVMEALQTDIGAKVEVPVVGKKHHWGVRVDLERGSCPFCLLPLGSPVLMQEGGIITFKCTHTFHSVCLSRQSSQTICPKCTKAS